MGEIWTCMGEIYLRGEACKCLLGNDLINRINTSGFMGSKGVSFFIRPREGKSRGCPMLAVLRQVL